MANYAFVQPIKPGMTQRWRELVSEIKGPRKAEIAASRKSAGLTREEVWLQSTPMGDMAVVYWEAPDINRVFKTLMTSTAPIDKWFAKEVFVGVHGMDPSAPPPPINEKVYG